ncbi:CmpA/NrtA family ABC transporter substrate-binding protein [Falsihalocynthiibacter sp. SS001]|uniref:CmpA/NrtA family ABC transporter substrate-binding protein n=1 Tax=Falsihalocynthiibacter sp. SS001 TaxID=3349698 RepID=UPI0036D2C7B5
MTPLSLGFVPLVDSAPLIIAHELGFAEANSISLNLVKHPSWSALRDMLALGHLDAAQMLSPAPIASSLNLGNLPLKIDVLMVLSVNGNNIGVAPRIAAKMRASGWNGDFQTPRETGQHLIKVAGENLRVGVPFPFAMHMELLHHWLSALGLHPQGLDIKIVPPPRMPDAIESGEIDAFCVGEPWGSLGVEKQVAELILPCSAIWSFAPEKVLAAPYDWIEENPQKARNLTRATYQAARWLDDPSNRMMAATLLARPDYLNLPEHIIDRALSRRIVPATHANPIDVPNFQKFHGAAANFPWRSQAAWIARRLAIRHNIDQAHALEVARACFRTDLYRQNLSGIGVDMPFASEKLEGSLSLPTSVASIRGEMILGPDAFFDGEIFDLSA